MIGLKPQNYNPKNFKLFSIDPHFISLFISCENGYSATAAVFGRYSPRERGLVGVARKPLLGFSLSFRPFQTDKTRAIQVPKGVWYGICQSISRRGIVLL